jgi:hypothetical protein
MDQTSRRWIVRIELVIGVAAVGLGVLAYLSLPAVLLTEPSPRENPIVLAGLVGLATGLAWMIRVVRGPKDLPSAWRQRDH